MLDKTLANVVETSMKATLLRFMKHPQQVKNDGSVVQEYQQDIGTFVVPYPGYPFGKVYK